MNIQRLPTRIHLRGYCKTRTVYVNEEKLFPDFSQAVWNHSPDGFNWGYGGSGPAQLSLAILLHYLPQNDAVSLHQKFKFAFVSKLPVAENFDVVLNLKEEIEKLVKNEIL